MGDRSGLPKRLSQKTAKALLEQHGWAEARGGKHVVKMEKAGYRPITLPKHQGQEYGAGLTAAILRQAALAGPGSEDGD
ncbi:MAG: type II toxin-antitoxin system HicA family toxin [Actinomycetales bacterium]